jgi:hypothetical protein
VCVSRRKRDPRAPQCAANVRVAKGRDWVRRLMPALALACFAVGLSAQIALADSMTLTPTHGQPSDPVTATYTYSNPTGACPANQLAISFWWDSVNYPISSALVNYDINKNCVAMLNFSPSGIKGALIGVGAHIVLAGPNGTLGARAAYTIDPPPPPPSPTPTPPPTSPPPTTPPPTTPPPTTPPPTTPPPTTPPPTTPPPTTPPPTTPPPTTPPPTHRPSPIPTPIQHVAPSPTPTTGCAAGTVSAACPPPSPTPCKQTAAVAPPTSPGGPAGGLGLALALFGGLPIVGVFLNSRVLMRRRELAKLACLIAVSALLVAGTSCSRPLARIDTAVTPTPTASVLPSPTC